MKQFPRESHGFLNAKRLYPKRDNFAAKRSATPQFAQLSHSSIGYRLGHMPAVQQRCMNRR